jgi:cyclophilin family peptidyl-prolyl cis-trans isomerase
VSGPQGASLPPKYSLFGKVVSGLDVVSAIDAIGTKSGAPGERVEIERVTISEAD